MRNPLKERLERIFIFRKHHHKFRQIIKKTLSNEVSGDKKSLEEVALSKIKEAYQFFHGINVLDISKEGFDLWDQTERTYNLKIDKVEKDPQLEPETRCFVKVVSLLASPFLPLDQRTIWGDALGCPGTDWGGRVGHGGRRPTLRKVKAPPTKISAYGPYWLFH